MKNYPCRPPPKPLVKNSTSFSNFFKPFSKYYLCHMVIYCLLLALFTFYIVYLFTNPTTTFWSFNDPTKNFEGNSADTKTENAQIFFIPMIMTILSLLLATSEVCQIWVQGKYYFFDVENYIEWLVLIFSTISAYSYKWIRDVTLNGAILRGVSAMGISLAWVELIFLYGGVFRNNGATINHKTRHVIFQNR